MKTLRCNLFLALALFAGAHPAAAQVLFTNASSPSVGANPYCVTAVDVNGDGKLDLVSANAFANTLTVLTNYGSGHFAVASSPNAGVSPVSVVAADVNGDGKVDFICANHISPVGSLTVLTNNGSGGFVIAASLGTGTAYTECVTTADVNGDGKVDLIAASQGGNTLAIFTNNGSGGFVLASSPVVGSDNYSVVAADVNGDGKVDLITANYNDNTLTVLTNDGNGGFGIASSPGVGSGPDAVTAADVNGDGKVDLICANQNSASLTVLTNDGSGGFVIASSPGVGQGPSAVTAADVNGDGKLDLVSGNSDGMLTVLTNNGSGGFAVALSPVVGTYPFSVVAADVNGDGRLDLVCANFGSSTLTVLTNNTVFPAPIVTNIVITPVNATIVISSNLQFNATGYFSDGSFQALTNGSAGTNLLWSSSSGNVASINTNGLATGATNGTTTITATSGSVSAHAALTVYNDQNVASFSATPNPAACHQVVSFDGSNSHNGDPRRNIVSYQWDFGDGSSGSGATITHTFNIFGSYTVLLTVTDDLGRTANTNATVMVSQGDQPPVANTGGPYIIKVGNLLALDGSGSADPDAACGDAIVSYTWFVNGGVTTTASPTLSMTWTTLQYACGISSAGTYPISLRVTDLFGQSGTNTTTLTITNPPPPLNISSAGDQTVLFWPASATNVVLQTTTNLASGNWVATSNGTAFTAVGFTNASPAQFFRLQPQ